MGVSGCGKSTIGKLLASKLKIEFFDADDFHPKSNIEKMQNGTPLTDHDREGWLESIHTFSLNKVSNTSIVIACSALKERYRQTLSQDLKTKWIFLKGSYELIRERMAARKGHYMAPSLLKSQFESLEHPKKAFIISIDKNKEDILNEIILLLDQENLKK